MNPCVTPMEFLSAELFFGNNTMKRVKLKGEPTEGECPWHWATQCLYNSYIWSVELLFEGDVKATWRSQGATHFIVYFHSSTLEVRRLLEYYEILGIMKLESWPSFGPLSPEITFNFPSFDSSTYRVGHTLAQNLCALEMETELGAIADFDEVMVSDESLLIDYIEKIMKNEKVGAISFEHLLVKFEPKISGSRYLGALNPVFLNRNGPPKVVFNSSSVDIILTHSVRRFIGNETIVKANGSLLHYRHNSYTESAEEVKKPYKLFPSYPYLHLKRISKTIEKVFGSQIPSYNSTYLHLLNQCISKIVGEGKCRSTVAYCKQYMEPLTDWVYDKTADFFLS
uniref:Glycosyltransferase family 92 protein n=1 Tax=Caenorhabditis tropicalis TaxID=1561998 RepID=A0A1I7V1X6_9PELO